MKICSIILSYLFMGVWKSLRHTKKNHTICLLLFCSPFFTLLTGCGSQSNAGGDEDPANSPPKEFRYSNDIVEYVINWEAIPNSPSKVEALTTSYSVAPQLPIGLNLDPNTGTISGEPTVLTPISEYTITASNAGGNSSAKVKLSVVMQPKGLVSDTGVTNAQCFLQAEDNLGGCKDPSAIALSDTQDGMTGNDINTELNNPSDGDLSLSYTKICNNGESAGLGGCPANPSPGAAPFDLGCVRDNNSDLIWEIKTDNNGLRAKTKTYTNYSSSFNPYGEYGSASDATGYVHAVNSSENALCGYRDWRLPEADEALSVASFGKAYPFYQMDSFAFGELHLCNIGDCFEYYWTGSTLNPDGVYALRYRNSTISDLENLERFNKLAIRLVRKTASNYEQSKRYLMVNNDQEVADRLNRLIWKRCPEGTSLISQACIGVPSGFLHENALAYVKELSLRTGVKWRLPNIKELYSLIYWKDTRPKIDHDAFPYYPVLGERFWSSTPNVNHRWDAYSLSLSFGFVQSMSRDSNLNALILVRDME